MAAKMKIGQSYEGKNEEGKEEKITITDIYGYQNHFGAWICRMTFADSEGNEFSARMSAFAEEIDNGSYKLI